MSTKIVPAKFVQFEVMKITDPDDHSYYYQYWALDDEGQMWQSDHDQYYQTTWKRMPMPEGTVS